MNYLSNIKRAAGFSLMIFLMVYSLIHIFSENAAAGSSAGIWIDSVQSMQRYSVRSLNKYAFVYSDREYVFTQIPDCLRESFYIKTANSDKFTRGNDLLTINISKPMIVYIGYDSRFTTKPEWLHHGFEPVHNMELVMGEPRHKNMAQVTYNLYRKRFEPGNIVLGGNLAHRERNNYSMFTIIMVEASKERCMRLDAPVMKVPVQILHR